MKSENNRQVSENNVVRTSITRHFMFVVYRENAKNDATIRKVSYTKCSNL